ncbi:lipoprotein [Streptomyces naganishii JCM 4654]|uniref:Lipoprotein n=1 Tax=Streptomyces naganishii JCM 4654 TaxID=1306179 RepID=A0A918Y6G5_9ACTN|nr:lipoprotein [Streptomyces naganishii JCM 4654]
MGRRSAGQVFGGVALAGVLVATVAGCGASAGDDRHPEHRAFALRGHTLTVDSDDSALEIVAADGNKAGSVAVTRWFQGSVVVGGDPKVTWAMKDDRLVLRVKCSGIVADCSAKHRIEVPRGVVVKVEDEDGSVVARGFRDALSVRTADGSVHVTDSTGPLELRSQDGSVRAEVSSRRVRATTVDGSVRLELGAVPDLVDTRSSDGSVSLALPHASYRVTTSTGDGSVNVSVPRDDSSAHVVSARTDDGAVTVRTVN